MKIRIFLLLLFCGILIYCSPKLDNQKALEVVKAAFQLSETDKAEVQGISQESNKLMLVKFKINEIQINSKMRRYDKGWQLDEIQDDTGMWLPASNIASVYYQFGVGKKYFFSQATELIKQSFQFIDNSQFDILGISKETKETFLVKFNLKSAVDFYEAQISARMRRYDKGWQFDEIQNKSGMWSPASEFIKSFQSAETIKKTESVKFNIIMKDMEYIASGIKKYISKNGVPPPLGENYTSGHVDNIKNYLVPEYLSDIPERDGFIGYENGAGCIQWHGISENSKTDFILKGNTELTMEALFRKGLGFFESWRYNPKDPEAGFIKISNLDEYKKITAVLFNGRWIRAPKFR
jgi:hypothetical protein